MSNNNPDPDYTFHPVDRALSKLGETIFRADGETRQSFIDLVEAVKRWKYLNECDGK